MRTSLARILGPRVPRDERRSHAFRYLSPTVLLLAAGALFGISYFQPYWNMTLHAPQYPKGLHVRAYLNRLVGDVHEIDGLNHYIGMRPLNDAAQFERATSAMMVGAVACLLLAAVFIHNRWAGLLALPAILFPVGFLADLQYWLATFGTHLDPHAALSSSIKPFVPPVLGVGTIGQFRTVAAADTGFWIATAGSLIVLGALWFHRRAYKPLVSRLGNPVSATTLGLSAMSIVMLSLGSPASLADANDSSKSSAAPVHPFVRMITTAPPGATVHIPAGTYPGGLVVNQSVTLIADGMVIIDGQDGGELVRITAPDVVLRGFHLRGSGDSLDQQHAGITVTAARAILEDNVLDDVLVGISLNNAPGSIVRRNQIHGKLLDLGRRGDAIHVWSSNDSVISDNQISGARDMVVWYSSGVQLTRNRVSNSRYGLHFMYANNGVVEENEFSDNSVGIFLMYSHDVLLRRNLLDHNRGPSGYGIGLKDTDGVRVEENLILANRVGLYVDNSPSRMDGVQDFTRNIFACNDAALALLPAVKHNRFFENEFRENIEQVAILGGGKLHDNSFSLGGRGNHWSDYTGFDADGDGIGDRPYHNMSLFENLIDREPKLRLFIYSPAHQAIELASRAFPVMRPEPKITDASPLMLPVAATIKPQQASSNWPISAASAGLLALAAFVTGNWRMRPRRLDIENAMVPGMDNCVAKVCTGSSELPSCLERNGLKEPSIPLVSIRRLRKTFGRQVAVAGLDLDIQPGVALALWGTNGAGKTTILKCVLGLHGYSGEILIGRFDARGQGKAARRLLGYVSQELSFYDDMTTRDTARFFARIKRVAIRRADEMIVRVGLGDHTTKRVGALSGGMKQRLALAVALLADPPLLLLDEPTSNLDAAARRSFLELLRELKQAGKTIVFTTHRPEEVTALADQVVLLEHGRMLQQTDAAGFATLEGAQTALRIPLADADRKPAFALLSAAGFDVSRNHTALIVRVPHNRKAAPLSFLARNGFDVSDFEFESENCHEN